MERLLDRVGAIATSKSARAALVVSQRRRLADASNTLWFKPTLAVFAALTLGLIFSRVHAAPGSPLWPLAFHGTSEDSRQVLTVIIGALIPVTSLTFALTVVTLQIASTQFSPRLLRTFLRDNRTQLVLSGLMGTVAYSVAGLFTVNTGVTATDEVPRLAISLALALALGCLGLLIYYFGHITNAVRIDTIMRHVESDTRAVIDLEHPRLGPESSDADREEIASSPAHAVMVTSPLDGYVQGVDPRLAELAVRKQVTVQMLPLIGYYTMVGRPLAQVWTDDGSELLGDDPVRNPQHDRDRSRAPSRARRWSRAAAAGRHCQPGDVDGPKRSLHRHSSRPPPDDCPRRCHRPLFCHSSFSRCERRRPGDRPDHEFPDASQGRLWADQTGRA